MRDSILRLAATFAFAASFVSAHGLHGQGPSEVPGSAADDVTYAQAVALLDTILVRPERAADIRALEPGVPRFLRLLADIALDARAPVYARGNALMMLAERGARRLDVFAVALEDSAMEVRAAAAVGLGRLLALGYDPRVVGVLRRALADQSQDVRVRGLEGLADHDASVLRQFLATSPEEPLADIARSMLVLAERRGAPVATGDAALGPLTTASAGGIRLAYEPARVWPDRGATLGRLRVEWPGGASAELSDRVEVVGGVLPAFVTADEAAVVYEAGREIFVYDLATRELRPVGPGIAPRPYPLRRSLIFFRRAESDGPTERGAAPRYDVIETPLGGGEERILGSVTAPSSALVHGGYSPVRWMRVREVQGGFVLHGEEAGTFPLPDPFDLPG